MLTSVDRAYTGIVVFDRALVPGLSRAPTGQAFPRTEDVGAGQLSNLTAVAVGAAEPVLWPSERLLVARVTLTSPGFWEFLGKLTPLEVLREYLNDRHRRRQDREFREPAEKRRLDLENQILELDVVQRRIETARQAGVPEDLIATAAVRLVVDPLLRLNGAIDDGVIDVSSQVVEIEPPP